MLSLNSVKGIYQTLYIRARLRLIGWLAKPREPRSWVKQLLKDRSFRWEKNRPTKVFAILRLNNWEEVLLKELSLFGQVTHFSWSFGDDFFESSRDWKKSFEENNRKLEAEFSDFYDPSANILVFVYASDFALSKEQLLRLKRSNVFIVHFCWDDLLCFSSTVKGQPVGVKKISKAADLCLTLSPEAIPFYTWNSAPCLFWDSKPTTETRPASLSIGSRSSDFYVLFVGSRYGWREQFIESIRAHGISVRCYGKGWENPPLSQSDMEEAIRKAPLTLGFSNVGYTRSVTCIKGRDFEVPLWGGLYLTQKSAGIERYYKPNEEVLTYTSLVDCVVQIQRVSRDPALANRIRSAGFLRAGRTASWRSRFEFLQETIQGVAFDG